MFQWIVQHLVQIQTHLLMQYGGLYLVQLERVRNIWLLNTIDCSIVISLYVGIIHLFLSYDNVFINLILINTRNKLCHQNLLFSPLRLTICHKFIRVRVDFNNDILFH